MSKKPVSKFSSPDLMKKYRPIISGLSEVVGGLAADEDCEALKTLSESVAFVFEAANDVFDLGCSEDCRYHKR